MNKYILSLVTFIFLTVTPFLLKANPNEVVDPKIDFLVLANRYYDENPEFKLKAPSYHKIAENLAFLFPNSHTASQKEFVIRLAPIFVEFLLKLVHQRPELLPSITFSDEVAQVFYNDLEFAPIVSLNEFKVLLTYALAIKQDEIFGYRFNQILMEFIGNELKKHYQA